MCFSFCFCYVYIFYICVVDSRCLVEFEKLRSLCGMVHFPVLICDEQLQCLRLFVAVLLYCSFYFVLLLLVCFLLLLKKKNLFFPPLFIISICCCWYLCLLTKLNRFVIIVLGLHQYTLNHKEAYCIQGWYLSCVALHNENKEGS